MYIRIDVIEGDDRGVQASKNYMVSAGGNLARYTLTPSTAGTGAGASYAISKRPFTGTVQGSSSGGSSSSSVSGGGSMKVDMPIVAPSLHGQKVYNAQFTLLYRHISILISVYTYLYLYTPMYFTAPLYLDTLCTYTRLAPTGSTMYR